MLSCLQKGTGREQIPGGGRGTKFFGTVNTQGFVWKFFLCAIYKFSFIHSYTTPNATLLSSNLNPNGFYAKAGSSMSYFNVSLIKSGQSHTDTIHQP